MDKHTRLRYDGAAAKKQNAEMAALRTQLAQLGQQGQQTGQQVQSAGERAATGLRGVFDTFRQQLGQGFAVLQGHSRATARDFAQLERAVAHSARQMANEGPKAYVCPFTDCRIHVVEDIYKRFVFTWYTALQKPAKSNIAFYLWRSVSFDLDKWHRNIGQTRSANKNTRNSVA